MWIINIWLVLCIYNFFSHGKNGTQFIKYHFFCLFYKNVVKICCRRAYIKEKNCNFARD